MSWNGFKPKSKKQAERRLTNFFQNLNIDGDEHEDGEGSEMQDVTNNESNHVDSGSAQQHDQALVVQEQQHDGASGELVWETAGQKRKEEIARLSLQRAEKRKAVEEAAARREAQRLADEIANAEEAIRKAEMKAQDQEYKDRERQRRRDERQAQKDEERYRKRTEGLDIMVRWFEAIMWRDFPDDELPIFIIVDTETGKEYVDGKLIDRVTEVGLTIVALWEVRKHMYTGMTMLQAWAAAMKTSHLRLIEHARFLAVDEKDRHEQWLWQAAYAEFGPSSWIHAADLPKVMKDTVFDAADIMSFHELDWRRPNVVEGRKPQIVLVAHDMKNDEVPIEKLGFKWADHFDVAAKVDTQRLCWLFARTQGPPPLHKCLADLNIKIIRKHHGGNDAAYTSFLLATVALSYIKHNGTLIVRDDPKAYVGALVEQYRLSVYKESSCKDINYEEACNICGSPAHDKLLCKFRCLYCHKPMRRSNGTYHNYLECPVRLADERAWVGADNSSLLRLHNTTKGFEMSANDQARLEGHWRRMHPHEQAVSSKFQSAKEHPAWKMQKEAHQNKGDFEKYDDDFPAL